MSSDYEQWKKRRDAKRSKKEQSPQPPKANPSERANPSEPKEPKPSAPPKAVDFRNQNQPFDSQAAREDYERWKRRRDAKRAGHDEGLPVGGSLV